MMTDDEITEAHVSHIIECAAGLLYNFDADASVPPPKRKAIRADLVENAVQSASLKWVGGECVEREVERGSFIDRLEARVAVLTAAHLASTPKD